MAKMTAMRQTVQGFASLATSTNSLGGGASLKQSASVSHAGYPGQIMRKSTIQKLH